MRIVFNLGGLVPALDGWRILITDEDIPPNEDYISIVRFEKDALKSMDIVDAIEMAIYLTAREINDYRIASALVIYSLRKKRAPSLNRLNKLGKHAKVIANFRRSDTPWGETYWKGVAYAQVLLDLEKPVVVKVIPPRDRRAKGRLRYLIEGTTVSARGGYRVGGLLKRVGGEKLAPWIYLIPKKKLAEFHQTVRGKFPELRIESITG